MLCTSSTAAIAGLRVVSGGITADYDGVKIKSTGLTVYQGGARIQTNNSVVPAVYALANTMNYTSSVLLVRPPASSEMHLACSMPTERAAPVCLFACLPACFVALACRWMRTPGPTARTSC